MALKPSKITSGFIQTCNKLFTSSVDASFRSKIPEALAAQSPQQEQISQANFRYKLNTGKSERLAELNFQQEPSAQFSELQPSAVPEFQFNLNPPRWAEKSKENSPFPATLRQKDRLSSVYSDRQKAEDKMMKYKMACFNPASRQYSTAYIRRYSKAPADNSGSGTCKKKVNKCYKTKPRTCKITHDCPKFKIADCEQSKGSNCKLNYLDPHCSKKFAPYPSYSESCAENLPDDPSECQQCPWRTCDGADTIEPGKPVRNKRNYSTSCSRHLDATAGIVVGPLLPPPLAEAQVHLSKGKCGQTKRPCKQPPGPCEVRKQKEDEKRREKEIHIPPRPKKASEDMNRMILASADGLGYETVLNIPRPNILDAVENQGSWIDIPSSGEMFLDKKQKYPHCNKKKKPKRPDDGAVDQDLSIEYGNTDWWSGRGKKTIVNESHDPSDCAESNCRDIKIRSKQSTIADKKSMVLSKKGPKKIKGDEGHPPPCPDHRNESLNCPDKPLKKPKYRKRPMTDGFYKQPEEPYSPSNGR